MSWSCEGDAAFIRGVQSKSGGEMSAWVWNDAQLATMEALGGVGNPIAIDTTFGSCAYATFFSLANRRLQRKANGRNPAILGPAMVHTKERDPDALLGFLRELKALMPNLTPVFSSDQDSMFMKRLQEVWPQAIILLGREHLLMNLKDRCRKLRVSVEDAADIKASIFGPAKHADRQPLLEALDAETFDDRLESLANDWSGTYPEFVAWIKVST
jgi:hypothetical protein